MAAAEAVQRAALQERGAASVAGLQPAAEGSRAGVPAPQVPPAAFWGNRAQRMRDEAAA